jgi:hypothetical protein
MKALGRYILDSMNGNFEPYFIVQENRNFDNVQKVPITEDLMREGHVCQRKIQYGPLSRLGLQTIVQHHDLPLFARGTISILRGFEPSYQRIPKNFNDREYHAE